MPDKPLAHHVAQINTYMQPYVINQNKHKKNVKGTLFYIEKAIIYGNSPQKEFEITFDETLFTNTMVRAGELKESLEHNILPPAEALVNKNYWECKLCSYFTKCRAIGKDAVDMNTMERLNVL